MPQATPPRPLPRWLLIVGSVGVAFHFFCLVIQVLATRSGPWPMPLGANFAEPPPFAGGLTLFDDNGQPFHLDGIDSWLFHLQWLRMTHTYHFKANLPDVAGVFFEVRLKDAAGREIKTLRFPDENANF